MSDTLKLSDGATGSTKGPILAVDFVEFWVSNAKITSKYYCSAWGFAPVSTKLTSNRQSHIVSQKDVTFIFTANTTHEDPEFTSFLQLHGDAVRDVALRVTDVEQVYERAISHGARSLVPPHDVHDNGGTIRLAKIAAPYGNVVHTLVERTKYKGETFLPKYQVSSFTFTGSPSGNARGCGLTHIDHVTFAYAQGDMKKAVDWYINCFGFEQFLCNDEDTENGLTVEGENSGLRTVILTSSSEPFSFKFVMVEAYKDSSNTKNQIHEFIECNGNSSGVQHLALHTKDIIVTVDYLRNRGIEFIDVPDTYYESLYKDENVKKSFMKDSYKTLRDLGVLLDISFSKDTPKLLMQTFTLPMQDRPTLFMEIICRKGSTGFGSKSIKTLFEAVEKSQNDRKINSE